MRRTPLIAGFSLYLLALAGCSRPPHLIQEQIYVFGTLVDVVVADAEPDRARQAFSEINTLFQTMHHEWHPWEEGPLVDLNRAIAAGQSAEVIPSLIPIIQQSQQLSRQSDGLFNPAIGGLLKLWGFQSSEFQKGRPPPPRAEIDQWLASAPAMADVHLDGNRLSSTNRAVQLDFGAFAKGYAVDRAIDVLRRNGIENAIVNAGGDLRAIGRKGDEPWHVGIRHPQGDGVIASLTVDGDESVFTSGNYERFNEYEGVRYMHILDPRTGWPVQGVTSVTVIYANGAVADAAATALVVAGSRDWYRIAKRMGIRAAMLVNSDGTVEASPEMIARLHFEGEVPANIQISPPLSGAEPATTTAQ